MSLSLPYSHLLYLEFYFRSSFQSEFLDLLTPKSGQNQELEEPRAPKKLLEPHESTTWQHLSFEYVDECAVGSFQLIPHQLPWGLESQRESNSVVNAKKIHTKTKVTLKNVNSTRLKRAT